MPTTELDIQATAVEAILHLRSQFPQVAEKRELWFFPVAAELGSKHPITVREDDPAIARLVQYITAEGMLIAKMIAEFRTLDRDATWVFTEAYREAHQVASQATHPIAIQPSATLSACVVA